MFLAKVLSLRMILSVEGLGITTFDTFLSKNERMRGGRFRVRVGASSSSLFCATQNCCLFCDLHDLAFRLAGRTMSNSLFARFLFRFSIGRNEASVFG